MNLTFIQDITDTDVINSDIRCTMCFLLKVKASSDLSGLMEDFEGVFILLNSQIS